MAEAARNHIVSAGYTKRFVGSSGLLGVFNKKTGQRIRDRRPDRAGVVNGFWGACKTSRSEFERRLSVVEGAGVQALERITADWGAQADPEVRLDVASLIGIHMTRNTRAQRKMREISEAILVRDRDKHVEEFEGGLATFHEHVRSDEYQGGGLLSQVRLAASLVGSMRWSLFEYAKPWIATSDHPVLTYPLQLPGIVRELEFVPDGGYFDSIEIRFPVDSHRILLGTWMDLPDSEEVVELTLRDLCDLNRGTVGLAEKQVMFCSDLSGIALYCPPETRVDCAPISFREFPNYRIGTIRNSKRRAAAIENSLELIETQTDVAKLVMLDRAA